MNKYVKKGLCIALATGLIASSFAGCAKINYVTNGAIQAIHEIKDGSWQKTEEEGPATDQGDVPVIDEFVAGTYGGKEFKTQDDLVNYYIECYNYSKSLTAPYVVDGTKSELYKLLGEEQLTVENLLIEGKSNSMIDGLVPGILGGIFKGWTKALPPNGGLDAANDKVGDGIDVSKSLLAPEDILAANAKDNGDGTITLTLQPKAVVLSMPGADSQGKFFNTLGDITSTVESISVLSFSEGTVSENFVVDYKGGSGVVTIDTATGEIVKADYTMKVHIDVKHANIAVIKDKSASLDVVYKNVFPASDQWLADHDISKG